MRGTVIRTYQNVVLDLNSNIVMWRVFAYGLDLLIIASYYYLILQLGDNILYTQETKFLFYSIMSLPALTYSLFTEFLLSGRTIGKYILGLRVVKINGLKCGFSEYILRWIFRLIDIYPIIFLSFFMGTYALIFSFLIGVPALVLIASSKNHQRLGDRVAGTTVIKLKNKISLSTTIFKEVNSDYEPVFAQAVKLSDNDMRIIKDFFTQARIKRDARTLKKLREKVEEVMEVESKMPDQEFLDVVINDFNHLTKDM